MGRTSEWWCATCRMIQLSSFDSFQHAGFCSVDAIVNQVYSRKMISYTVWRFLLLGSSATGLDWQGAWLGSNKTVSTRVRKPGCFQEMMKLNVAECAAPQTGYEVLYSLQYLQRNQSFPSFLFFLPKAPISSLHQAFIVFPVSSCDFSTWTISWHSGNHAPSSNVEHCKERETRGNEWCRGLKIRLF